MYMAETYIYWIHNIFINVLFAYTYGLLPTMQFLKLDDIKQIYNILEARGTLEDGSYCFKISNRFARPISLSTWIRLEATLLSLSIFTCSGRLFPLRSVGVLTDTLWFANKSWTKISRSAIMLSPESNLPSFSNEDLSIIIWRSDADPHKLKIRKKLLH